MSIMALPGAASAGLAVLAAISWGGGDFSGGMAVKHAGGSTRGALRVIAAAHAVSLFVLLIVVAPRHGQLPHGAPLIWGLVAGVSAGLSLTAFYIALARGAMGASAAVSGLLAAAIPAAVSLWLEGAPTAPRMFGFTLAAAAIWLIAVTPTAAGMQKNTPGTMGLAIFGGIGFGVYFVALRFANPLGIIEPIALARVGSLATCLVLLLVWRGTSSANRTGGSERWLSRKAWLWALGVAVLDTGGNMLFIAATRAGRLDVAAVLASLYPASTILLAASLLHERPSRRQYAGMGVAVAAVVLITV